MRGGGTVRGAAQLMLTGLQIALLLLGVILLVASIPALSKKLLGEKRASSARVLPVVRTALGVAGAALIVGVLAVKSQTHAQRGAAPPSPAPGAAATLGAVPTPDLVASATDALAACDVPTPPAVPDGASASLSQMSAAQSAFKGYDAATLRYVNCVDASIERTAKDAASRASAEELEKLRIFGTSAHNSAIDREQALADRFNEQIRTYKAKHPG